MKPTPPIDEKQVESLARIGADDADIAALLRLPVRKLLRQCRELISHARAERRVSILRMIWEVAKEGNVTLLAWLGKTELGWVERDATASPIDAPSMVRRFDHDRFLDEFVKLTCSGAIRNGEQENQTGQENGETAGGDCDTDAPPNSPEQSVHSRHADGEAGDLPDAAGE